MLVRTLTTRRTGGTPSDWGREEARKGEEIRPDRTSVHMMGSWEGRGEVYKPEEGMLAVGTLGTWRTGKVLGIPAHPLDPRGPR